MMNAFAIAIAFSSVVLMAQQAVSVDWQLDNTVGAEDRDAILALSREMGIEQPHKISFGRFRPSPCRFVRVESSVIENNNHLSWFELNLRPPESDCFRFPPGAKSVGRWVSLGSLEKREEWRFRDGQWYIDMPLGPETPYGDAELIVRAIRRGGLINRLARSGGPLNSRSNLSKIDADTITGIWKQSDGVRRYQVRTGLGGGFMLRVRIIGSRVELYSYSPWII